MPRKRRTRSRKTKRDSELFEVEDRHDFKLRRAVWYFVDNKRDDCIDTLKLKDDLESKIKQVCGEKSMCRFKTQFDEEMLELLYIIIILQKCFN